MATRNSLKATAVERWQKELKAIHENDIVKLSVRRADSAAHLLRDAIRAARIHNIEPYCNLYRNVKVEVLGPHLLVVSKKSNEVVIDIEEKPEQQFKKPNSFEEALEKIESFIYSSSKILKFDVCPEAFELETEAIKLGLYAKANGEKLVVIKPDDFAPPKKEPENG